MIPCPDCGGKDLEQEGNESRCRNCGKRMIIPHPAQIRLLRSRASIAIFGGAKGGGKSYSLLLEATRHLDNPNFAAVIFRREGPQIYGPGGLWDTSEKIFSHCKGSPARFRGEWTFPSGARVRFAHLMLDRDVKAWDGQQVPLIGFDELTLFTEKQFWYMMTINRSTCGVTPYMRATCNPDADSWVARLLEWWIDQDTGYPIPERGGVLRWFVREGGQLVWANSRQELLDQFPKQVPKSLTFIPAKLEDNPTLDLGDPGYRANLLSQETVIRDRLLKGNWKVRPAAGLKFPHHAWKHFDAPPDGLRLCRYWDKAGTEGGKGARTAGVLMGELNPAEAAKRGLPHYWIVHAVAARWSDAEREARIHSQAVLDNQMYGHVAVGLEQEPGSGGKHSAWVTVTNLAGFEVFAERATTNKSARWTPLAAQQQAGNVAIVRSNTWDWAGFINELDALAGDARTAYADFENLDQGKLKDLADAASGAFKYLAPGGGGTTIQGDLIASDEDDTPLTTEEKAGMPEFLRDLIGEADSDPGDVELPWDR